MSVTVAAFTPRLRTLLRELDAKKPIGIDYLHQLMRNQYVDLDARWPKAYSYTAAAGTIAAGADSFTLPTTSSAEYGPDIRVQLVTNGQWLTRRSQDEMQELRRGLTSSNQGGIPTDFAPYEDSSQQVICWIYPRCKDAQSYNLFRSLVGADFSSTDIEATTLPLSREAQDALLYKTAAAVVMALADDELADRRMSPARVMAIAAQWDKMGERLFYQEYDRRASIESIGRVQRFVG